MFRQALIDAPTAPRGHRQPHRLLLICLSGYYARLDDDATDLIFYAKFMLSPDGKTLSAFEASYPVADKSRYTPPHRNHRRLPDPPHGQLIGENAVSKLIPVSHRPVAAPPPPMSSQRKLGPSSPSRTADGESPSVFRQALIDAADRIREVTYSRSGATRFVLSGYYARLDDDATDLIFYAKFMLSPDGKTLSAFEASYPVADKSRYSPPSSKPSKTP